MWFKMRVRIASGDGGPDMVSESVVLGMKVVMWISSRRSLGGVQKRLSRKKLNRPDAQCRSREIRVLESSEKSKVVRFWSVWKSSSYQCHAYRVRWGRRTQSRDRLISTFWRTSPVVCIHAV